MLLTCFLRSIGILTALSVCLVATITSAEGSDRKKVYLKDGSVITCEQAWQGQGDSVWCRKSQGVIGYPAGLVDLQMTFEMPDKVARLVDQSYSSFLQRDWDAVIRDADEALSFDIYNVKAYTNRAGAFNYKGLPQKAIQDCTRAIEIDPVFPLAYNNRGHAFEMLGNSERAILDYRKGCSLGSDLACRNLEILSGEPAAEK